MPHSHVPQTRALASLCISIVLITTEIIGAVQSTLSFASEQFMYYTQLSNYFLLLAAVLWVIFLLRLLCRGAKIPGWVYTLKYMATCMVALTFLVSALVLSPTCGGFREMMFGYVVVFFHTICPLLAIADFLFFTRGQIWRAKHLLLAMLPTAAYAAVSIVLNILRVWHGPYPFLLVHENPIWMSCMWAVVIPGAALGLAALLRLGNRVFSEDT